MRLDELSWKSFNDEWDVVYVGNVNLWRLKEDGIQYSRHCKKGDIFIWSGPKNESGAYQTYWHALGPLEAQCVLYELTRTSNETQTGAIE